MRLHELLDGLEHANIAVDPSFELRGDGGVDVRSVVHDSRDVAAGALFCCIRGEHTDGHVHAPAAVAAGAVACLVERWLDVDVPQVRVPSVRPTLGPLSARLHGEPSRTMRVLGVTGTNGKTTTTYLLEQVAIAAGERAGLIGTTGARIDGAWLPVPHTTPEATELQSLLARMRDAETKAVSMEVSSHALAQYRVDGTHFEAAAFTNLSHDHLDYHGDLEAYFEAKARLFTPAFTMRAAIGVDGDAGRTLASRARASGVDVLTYAATSEADVTVTDVELTADATSCVIEHDGARLRVRSSLVGAFNVSNLLCAYATSRQAGYTSEVVVAGLGAPVHVPGRMEAVSRAQPFRVFVDYAHTPDALAAVLSSAREFVAPGGRLAVVFGCGGDRDARKRPLMGAVAARLSDSAYLTSDNPRSEDPAAIAHDVLRGITTGMSEPVVELDRRRAIRLALAAARSGDVVVIAGKGHESGQTAKGHTLPFDDRIVAREELEARV